MKYKQQFIHFNGAFSEDDNFDDKFLRHGQTIVAWCMGNNIKPRAFCRIAATVCEYFEHQDINATTFAAKKQEFKLNTFERIANDNAWDTKLVENIYNQIYNSTGHQTFK